MTRALRACWRSSVAVALLLASTTASAGGSGMPHCACALTQGYWKTHSEYGPAPYDDAWSLLPDGADTEFFDSGLTWYEQFLTAPAGDAYFILSHQYAAAELNLLNGSMAPGPVQMALANAEALFEAQGTDDTTLTAAETRQAIRWAAIIDDYNNGVTGPKHCYYE